MKQNAVARRPRNRVNNNRTKSPNVRSTVVDISGRGRSYLMNQVDKYSSMAREAKGGGDRVLAENYWQHADHYQRQINDIKPVVVPTPNVAVKAEPVQVDIPNIEMVTPAEIASTVSEAIEAELMSQETVRQ